MLPEPHPAAHGTTTNGARPTKGTPAKPLQTTQRRGVAGDPCHWSSTLSSQTPRGVHASRTAPAKRRDSNASRRSTRHLRVTSLVVERKSHARAVGPTRLEELPNVGPKTVAKLQLVGVYTPEDLAGRATLRPRLKNSARRPESGKIPACWMCSSQRHASWKANPHDPGGPTRRSARQGSTRHNGSWDREMDSGNTTPSRQGARSQRRGRGRRPRGE
jgi:hypothetical protein